MKRSHILGLVLAITLALSTVGVVWAQEAPPDDGTTDTLPVDGTVIGINTLILSRSGSSSGVGFAVPINMAKQAVPVLIEEGEYQYAWLGITGTDLTPTIVEAMNLPANTRGALVIEVGQDGPADKAGLQGSIEAVEIKGRPLEIGGTAGDVGQ